MGGIGLVVAVHLDENNEVNAQKDSKTENLSLTLSKRPVSVSMHLSIL